MDSVPCSVSSTRPVPGSPQLLLSAPRIAGYLPARVTHPPLPAFFTYANPRLATLSPSKHQAILTSARDLLDAALLVACGEGNDLDLLMAQARFYETVGGKPIHTPPPSRRAMVEMAREAQSRLDATWERLQAQKQALLAERHRRYQEFLDTLGERQP